MEPNVLVIVADALRADRVGAFGGRQLTPNIDQLASDSTVFSNAFTSSNVTDVAVTSLQTGRYPLSHGVLSHGFHVSDREKSTVENVTQLPEVLSDAGYRTAKFGRPLGRWHRRGFDEYPSSMESRRAFDHEDKDVTERVGDLLERVHPKLRKTARETLSKLQELRDGPPEKEEVLAQYREGEDEVVQSFEEFVRGSTPFYSFVHLMDTHIPFLADPEVVRSYLEEFDYRTDVPMRATGKHADSFDRLVAAGEYPEIAEKYYRPDGTPTTAITDAHYDAGVSRTDERVGELVDVLKRAGELENTLVVFLADHGESLTEHGIYYDHHGLYDVTIRIPMLVKPPGTSPGRAESDAFVQITDIAPTIEAYAETGGLDPDGVSLRPVIEGEGAIDREFVLAEESHTQRRRMVRSDSSKLIYSLDGDTICRYCEVQHAPAVELYDLVDDPAETENVAGERAEDVERLRAYGDEAASEFEAKCPSDDSDREVTYEDEAEMHERLEALGYR